MDNDINTLAEMLANKINELAEAARADRRDFNAWTQSQDDDNVIPMGFRA